MERVPILGLGELPRYAGEKGYETALLDNSRKSNDLILHVFVDNLTCLRLLSTEYSKIPEKSTFLKSIIPNLLRLELKISILRLIVILFGLNI